MKPILFFAAAFAVAFAATAQNVSTDHYQELKYRHIGPVGNRIASVAGVPDDPLTYYAGAATGGIWKSVDGGEYWKPIFDGQPDHAIGALAVAPSDPQIVWAGTGEPHLRSNVSIGSGVYKSTDGGETWQEMNMKWPSRTARIVIHPTNPDIVFVAALGHRHGPQKERGIFRTLDGGTTWKHVLAVDENTGASSLEMDPNNPRILYAGMWEVVIHTWGRESGGEGSGIHKSKDGGETWTELEGNGLPELTTGIRIYLQAVIDNFSRRILAWRVSEKLSSATTRELLIEASEDLPDAAANAGVLVVNRRRCGEFRRGRSASRGFKFSQSCARANRHCLLELFDRSVLATIEAHLALPEHPRQYGGGAASRRLLRR